MRTNWNVSRLGLPAPQRIVILRALQLGSSLCTIPAWRALRAAFPYAHISLVGLPWARSFVDRFHYLIDELIEFPGFPGFPEREPDATAFPAFLSYIQAQRYDLALQMHGPGDTSNALVQLFGARRSAGFYLPGGYCPHDHNYLPYPSDEHEIWRHLRLMQFLGLPLQGEALEFPLYEADWQALKALPAARVLQPGGYVIVHAGARAEDRRWPAAKFAQLADALAARGLQVILTGIANEAPLAAEVQRRMSFSALNLAGHTSLGAIAALLSGARLLVSNDSGVSHLAAALKTPSVVLFLASGPQRWAPLNKDLHTAITWAVNASADEVLERVTELLARQPFEDSLAARRQAQRMAKGKPRPGIKERAAEVHYVD